MPARKNSFGFNEPPGQKKLQVQPILRNLKKTQSK